MSNEHRNDYDDMKRFLNIVRKNSKPLLKEETAANQLSSDEISQEEDSFRNAVTNAVEFDKIILYDNNIEWRGKLSQLNTNWVYDSSDAMGVYIQTNALLQLTDENMEILNKLKVYFVEWSQKWNEELFKK